MGVEFLVDQIERAAEKLISRMQGKLLMLLSLLAAAGFATASASHFLSAEYGVERGDLIIALAFGVVSMLAYIIGRMNGATKAAAPPPDERPAEQSPLDRLIDASGLNATQADLGKALSAAGPELARLAVERIPKNIHLILGAAIGLLIAARLAKSVGGRG